MASDTREVVIRLVAESADVEELSLSTNGSTKEEKNGFKVLNSILHPVNTIVKAINKASPAGGLIAKAAYNSVKSQVLYAINRNFSLREDYQSENTMKNTMGVIGEMVGLGTAVLSGAAIGGPAGAIVGATAWFFNEITTSYQKYDQIQIALNQDIHQSTFQRVRMGLFDGGRGTEN